jgi:hypothetical protein
LSERDAGVVGRDAAAAGREGGAVAEKSSSARAPPNRVLPNRRRTAPIRLLTSAASTMIAMIAWVSKELWSRRAA